MREPTDHEALIVSFAYLVATTTWVYVAPHSSSAAGGALLATVLVIQFALGLFSGRWWTLLLPFLVVVFSMPLPDGRDGPAWGYLLLFGVPPAMVVIAVGVGARRLLRTRGQAGQR